MLNCSVPDRTLSSYLRKSMKRVIDILGAGLGLLVLSPLMIVVAVLVWLNLGRPVFFRQTRPGLNGAAFELIKFRTMRDAHDASGRPLPDAARLPKFGSALRSLSLDELPELWNVLKGEMSLVGPRPLLMDYLALYSPHQARRHEVKPGLTGWAQVNGRNALDWESRFNLDVWYVENWSLSLDLKILALTVWKVVAREGISASGEATVARFRGSSQEEIR